NSGRGSWRQASGPGRARVRVSGTGFAAVCWADSRRRRGVGRPPGAQRAAGAEKAASGPPEDTPERGLGRRPRGAARGSAVAPRERPVRTRALFGAWHYGTDLDQRAAAEGWSACAAEGLAPPPPAIERRQLPHTAGCPRPGAGRGRRSGAGGLAV